MDQSIIENIKTIDTFSTVPENQLQWLIDKSTIYEIPKGELLFKKGDPIDRMYVFLKGRFSLKVAQNNQFRIVGTIERKDVTGNLPYSRATNASGYAEAMEDCIVMALHKDHFKEMIHQHDELTTVLVHTMSSRIRKFTKLEQQNDKMMALGKLSAGLAHELNNPSAAVVRSADVLQKHLATIPEYFKSVIKIRMNDEQVDAVNNILFSKLKNTAENTLTLMEKAEREDEIIDWMEEHGIEDGYELADIMADFGFTIKDLETIDSMVSETDLPPVIRWLNQVLNTEKIVNEIKEASQRINDLVCSVKSYTHMDRAPEKQAADIHIGISNTLTMLTHKLKKGGIEVVKNFGTDLPQPKVFVSELNQVWTNLIDNAIDAMEDTSKKVLEIETKEEGEFVSVNVIDSGEGIPEEVIDNIFDPFYTTKSVGKGTGMGLDVVRQIVNQHLGSIKVESVPGRTVFKVCIPKE